MDPFKTVKLNKAHSEHLYVQLFKSLRALIFNGMLPPHEKLPPIRKMAELLDVNNVTVVNAYKLLEDELLVYKKIGSGTFVAPVSEEPEEGLVKVQPQRVPYDFTISSPTADLFPVDDFKLVLNEVLERDKGFAFGYQESKGFLPLRQSLCQYLEAQSIVVGPESLQIISGAQQGIDLVSKALLDYGDAVVVEAPTYTGAIANFKLKGATIIEVPLESDGLAIEHLESLLKRQRIKLLYLMPNCQNPTGISYSEAKRERLIALSKQYNFWIVEDDYASDLHYGQMRFRSLKHLSDSDKIIHIKSFSKVLMPGLRLGFMIVPPALAEAIGMAKHTADISTSGLIQRAFDLYIRKGFWDKQMQTMRALFEKRYLCAKAILSEGLPEGVSFIDPQGGYNFWITLPEGYSADELAWKLSEQGVAVVAGSVFYHTQMKSTSFRISIAGLETDQIETGLYLLLDQLKRWLNTGKSASNAKKPVL